MNRNQQIDGRYERTIVVGAEGGADEKAEGSTGVGHVQ